MNQTAPRALSASARGAAHIRRGTPNQDFAGWEALPDGAFALALADGHGADLHARSADGARLAVEACLAEMRAAWGQRANALRGAPDAEAQGIFTAVLALWRDKVDAAIAADPLEASLAAASEAAGLGAYGPYGTTLVAALLWPGGGLAMQQGDGNLFIHDGAGQLRAIIPEDPHEGEETASLCEPDAPAHARFAALGPWRGALLASDGFAKSFADGGAVSSAALALLDRIAAGTKAAELEMDLAALSAKGSSDDISIAALVSDAHIPLSSPSSSPRFSRGGGGRGWLLAIILLLAFALLVRQFSLPPQPQPPAATAKAENPAPGKSSRAKSPPRQTPKRGLPSTRKPGGNDAGQSQPDPK